jgi:hypothetical protein
VSPRCVASPTAYHGCASLPAPWTRRAPQPGQRATSSHAPRPSEVRRGGTRRATAGTSVACAAPAGRGRAPTRPALSGTRRTGAGRSVTVCTRQVLHRFARSHNAVSRETRCGTGES